VKLTPVRVQNAAQGPAVPPIDTNGLVMTKHEQRMSFKMGGVVRRIAVQEGQSVKRGQRLAEIELTEVNAQVEQARQMAGKGSSRSQARREPVRRPGHQPGTTAGPAHAGRMAEASFKSAQFNMGYSVITAPGDGVVLRKLVEERELVGPGTPVLVFGESDSGYVVRAALADREIVNVKIGDKGEIRMDAFPGQLMTGTIVEVAERRGRALRHVPARGAFRHAAAAAGQRPGGAPAPGTRELGSAAHLRARWRRWSKATAIAPLCSCSTTARRKSATCAWPSSPPTASHSKAASKPARP
jgi:multidrug efflux pump subunit AcrA (membrane-fusion protein)